MMTMKGTTTPVEGLLRKPPTRANGSTRANRKRFSTGPATAWSYPVADEAPRAVSRRVRLPACAWSQSDEASLGPWPVTSLAETGPWPVAD